VNLRLHTPLAAAVAIVTGFLLLAALLLPGLEEAGTRLLNWAVLLAAVALLLGLANLFMVHLDRLRSRQQPTYSLILLVAMLVTFGLTIWEGSTAQLPAWIFTSIQVPVEESLMAILAISLTLAAARFLQNRTDLMGTVFIVTLFIVLVGSAPLFGLEIPIFTRTLGPYVTGFLAIGALRGLLIGVGLGALLTGLRILIASDRPYGG
jgi:hypothetical protein